MKLLLGRGQAKGMLGGISFELHARVELTREEEELVRKYRANKEVLFSKEGGTARKLLASSLGAAPIAVQNITIESLVSGQTFKCQSIAEILAYEETVKDACGAFKTYLEAMRSFGGEEVIEY